MRCIRNFQPGDLENAESYSTHIREVLRLCAGGGPALRDESKPFEATCNRTLISDATSTVCGIFLRDMKTANHFVPHSFRHSPYQSILSMADQLHEETPSSSSSLLRSQIHRIASPPNAWSKKHTTFSRNATLKQHTTK